MLRCTTNQKIIASGRGRRAPISCFWAIFHRSSRLGPGDSCWELVVWFSMHWCLDLFREAPTPQLERLKSAHQFKQDLCLFITHLFALCRAAMSWLLPSPPPSHLFLPHSQTFAQVHPSRLRASGTPRGSVPPLLLLPPLPPKQA